MQHKGQMMFGRNYDWVTGTGLVITNPRGLSKVSLPMPDGGQISWSSKFGSITFNQYGKEFPNGGMNEKGLVVELMWLDGTKYAQQDERASLGVLQWIQYQLDNASSVQEVIASDTRVRISAGSVPLHYLIADATGDAATIEFINGKMVVHRGKSLPYPVLSNSTYSTSVEHLRSYGGSADNSLQRFAEACRMVEGYQPSSSMLDYSFSILKRVGQGDFTKWSVVYDLPNRKIHFKTNRHSPTRTLALNRVDFACIKPSLSIDINAPLEGDITSHLSPLSPTLNEQTLLKAFRESETRLRIPADLQRSLVGYPAQAVCQ